MPESPCRWNCRKRLVRVRVGICTKVLGHVGISAGGIRAKDERSFTRLQVRASPMSPRDQKGHTSPPPPSSARPGYTDHIRIGIIPDLTACCGPVRVKVLSPAFHRCRSSSRPRWLFILVAYVTSFGPRHLFKPLTMVIYESLFHDLFSVKYDIHPNLKRRSLI